MDASVAEIERRAADRRFVQVLLPAIRELPERRRSPWPVWEACERHDVPDAQVPRLLDHLGGDAMLLWGSGIPHRQQDGPPAPPPGLDLARLSASALSLDARLDAEVPA